VVTNHGSKWTFERTPSESGCTPRGAKIKKLGRKLSRDAPKARYGIGQCLKGVILVVVGIV
jgi:hypothetical protein